ncbi:MAG TPA: hypothetical protein VGJ31_15825 [Dongiaceae bacterium]
MTIHNRIDSGRIEPGLHRGEGEFWPRLRPSPLIELRQHRRRLRWANIGFATVAFLLLALAVLSILYVGPSPIAGPGAPPLHSRVVPVR